MSFGNLSVLRSRRDQPCAPDRPPQPIRALPGWAVDAILFGLPDKDACDGRKVWTMCMRIAMSAHRRGWSESEYLVEIMHHKSRLWQQPMTRRDGRTSSMRTAHKSLLKAWETGVANANNVGMRTREEIRADAVELAYIWSDRISERVDGLNPTEEAVMSYVIAETERRGMLRVTFQVGQSPSSPKPHTGLPRASCRCSQRGLLVQHSPGRRGKNGRGKAAIYGLVGPNALGT